MLFWQRHTADQVRTASDSLGTNALLPGRMLSHFAGTHEHFVSTPASLPDTGQDDG